MKQSALRAEQQMFCAYLYRELAQYARKSVRITLNGRIVPLWRLADRCMNLERGHYYARKKYGRSGELKEICFVPYRRR